MKHSAPDDYILRSVLAYYRHRPRPDNKITALANEAARADLAKPLDK